MLSLISRRPEIGLASRMRGQGPLSLQFSGLYPVLSVDSLFRLIAGLMKFQESYPGLKIDKGFYRFLMSFFFLFFFFFFLGIEKSFPEIPY